MLDKAAGRVGWGGRRAENGVDSNQAADLALALLSLFGGHYQSYTQNGREKWGHEKRGLPDLQSKGDGKWEDKEGGIASKLLEEEEEQDTRAEILEERGKYDKKGGMGRCKDGAENV